MYADMKVTIHMLTRTCVGCGESGEFPFVAAEDAATKVDTWRAATRKRETWWSQHAEKCSKANAA